MKEVKEVKEVEDKTLPYPFVRGRFFRSSTSFTFLNFLHFLFYREQFFALRLAGSLAILRSGCCFSRRLAIRSSQ